MSEINMAIDSEITEETAQAQQSDVSTERLSLPGRLLREARDKFQLSIADVAAHLFLPQHTIVAIESDDYAKLPAPTFVKGYLRAYASMVGVCGDEIIKCYDSQDLPDTVPQAAVLSPVEPRKKTWRDRSIRWFGYITVVALLVLAGVWWHNHKFSAQDPGISTRVTTTTSMTTKTTANTANKTAIKTETQNTTQVNLMDELDSFALQQENN